MVESVGHAVSRLIRIRYGAMMLPRGLRRGLWMELGERDIRALGEASGTPERVISGGHEPAPAPADKPRRARADRGRGSGPRPNMAGGAKEAKVAPSPRLRGEGRVGGGGAQSRRANDSNAAPPTPTLPPQAGRGGRAASSETKKAAPGYIGADSFARQRAQPRGGAGGGKRRAGPGGRRG
jgi:23S rRNA pseudouridine2605 synthase